MSLLSPRISSNLTSVPFGGGGAVSPTNLSKLPREDQAIFAHLENQSTMKRINDATNRKVRRWDISQAKRQDARRFQFESQIQSTRFQDRVKIVEPLTKTSKHKRDTQLRYHDTSLMLKLTEGRSFDGS